MQNTGHENDGRKIDESWKDEAAIEKERLSRELDDAETANPGEDIPPPTFLSFISGFAAQVLIQLGEIKNPLTQKTEPDLLAARYAIDTLSILRDKTSGNLSADEERYFDAMLSDIRMRYVRACGAAPDGAGGKNKVD